VTLSSGHSNTVSVNFATAPGSAGSSDYQSNSGTLTFSPGQTVKGVSVSTVQDPFIEGNETFYVNLSNATGGIAISDGQGAGTIIDDDNCGLACQ
jgi:hypothetical protein